MAELQGLLDKCLTAFGKSAQEAQKTFELLGDLGNVLASRDRLLAIAEQERIERRAQGE